MKAEVFSTNHVQRKLISIKKKGFRVNHISNPQHPTNGLIIATYGDDDYVKHCYRNLRPLLKTICYTY